MRIPKMTNAMVKKSAKSKPGAGLRLPALPPVRRSPPRPLPQLPKEWLAEIQDAWVDAGAAKPFGPLVGIKITDVQLFHVAPLVALKFRGKSITGKRADKIREAALATYVANFGTGGPKANMEKYAPIAFALCYVVSHVALGLIDEGQAQDIMEMCEASVFTNKARRGAKKKTPRRIN